MLKDSRLWVAFRHGAFQDVQLVLVHVDRREGAGAVRIGELELMSFNEVDVVL